MNCESLLFKLHRNDKLNPGQKFFQISFHIFTRSDGDGRPEKTSECSFILFGPVVIAEQLDHRNGFACKRLEVHGLAGSNNSFTDHSAVQPRAFGLPVLFHKLWVAHARGQRAAWGARRGEFEDRRAYVQTVAYFILGTFQIADGQVIAKRTRARFLPQFL